MTLGEKIRQERRARHLTQSQVAGEYMTRNMLSRIESGDANPSLQTLLYLSEKLSLPISFLTGEEENLDSYRLSEKIPAVRRLFREGSYESCLALIREIGVTDDELDFLAAYSALYLGKIAAKDGHLLTAKKLFTEARERAARTCYPTEEIEALLLLYLPITENIQSPLLEMDTARYTERIHSVSDYELFRYLLGDQTYPYRNPLYKRHIEARALIRARRYSDALVILTSLDDERKTEPFDAYFTLALFMDLETCYKELFDFERAYRFATKRMSLLQSFRG